MVILQFADGRSHCHIFAIPTFCYGKKPLDFPIRNSKLWRIFRSVTVFFVALSQESQFFLKKGFLYTALSGKLKWQKNIQSISRLLWERPHPGLRNEPPLDSLDPQSLNPFMASLWIGSGEGLAIKGFGDWGSRLSSGGSFWSPGWVRSCSSLEIDWIFFLPFLLPRKCGAYQGHAKVIGWGSKSRFFV